MSACSQLEPHRPHTFYKMGSEEPHQCPGLGRACKFCDKPLPERFVDDTCDGCWEVAHRLEDFLRLPKGRALVEDKLRAYDKAMLFAHAYGKPLSPEEMAGAMRAAEEKIKVLVERMREAGITVEKS